MIDAPMAAIVSTAIATRHQFSMSKIDFRSLEPMCVPRQTTPHRRICSAKASTQDRATCHEIQTPAVAVARSQIAATDGPTQKAHSRRRLRTTLVGGTGNACNSSSIRESCSVLSVRLTHWLVAATKKKLTTL